MLTIFPHAPYSIYGYVIQQFRHISRGNKEWVVYFITVELFLSMCASHKILDVRTDALLQSVYWNPKGRGTTFADIDNNLPSLLTSLRRPLSIYALQAFPFIVFPCFLLRPTFPCTCTLYCMIILVSRFILSLTQYLRLEPKAAWIY